MNLPKFPQTSTNERVGVMRVATILTEMGLIFRETSNSDTGIDGYIEEVNNYQEATGRLLAVQIKSGASYLHEQDEYFVFYTDEAHIKYWKLYPIPVILCVHNPDTRKTYYQAILSHGHVLSSKILIPKKQVLSYENREDIFACIAGFSSAYHTTEELYTIMSSKRITICNNSYVSFLDLFVGGLTNLCTDLFCDTSVLSNLIDLRTKLPMFYMGQQDHEFLWEFIKFITKENLAKVNFEACLYDWEDRMMDPRILVPLTYRGIELRNYIEQKHPDTISDSSVCIHTDLYWDERMEKLMMPE